MRNDKLRNLAPSAAPDVTGPATAPPLAPASANIHATPAEGLRLMQAFVQIADEACRARLIEEAERMAQG